jgi:nucleotide-binding universal stress UspA family protein
MSEPTASRSNGYTALLATDGSPAALHALRGGLEVLRPDAHLIVATVTSAPDPSLVTGTGIAGGVMTFEEKHDLMEEQFAAARAVLDNTVSELGIDAAETIVLEGRPGPALCAAAADRSASVIVLGTRGHGGIRRAVLGSVSDHVARHASCAVLTIADDEGR